LLLMPPTNSILSFQADRLFAFGVHKSDIPAIPRL
jgi:hypothetical protein